jgi:alkylation response protein AidB-like acyl-CoA dehydrogenase
VFALVSGGAVSTAFGGTSFVAGVSVAGSGAAGVGGDDEARKLAPGKARGWSGTMAATEANAASDTANTKDNRFFRRSMLNLY